MSTISNLVEELFNLPDIEILDVGNRMGITSYIDFININEIRSPVMKGRDCTSRPFFTLCANIIYDDGSSVPTFTTFFQRYSNYSHLWVGAGSFRALMETGGGVNIAQFTFLVNLIKNGTVVFEDGSDTETIEALRLINYVTEPNGKITYSFDFRKPKEIILQAQSANLYACKYPFCHIQKN